MNALKKKHIFFLEPGNNTEKQVEINADEARWKKHEEIIAASKKVISQNYDNEQRTEELTVIHQELVFQNHEKNIRAQELVIANRELNFQIGEKGKRADELLIADKELAYQNKEKEKRAAELVIANDELDYQNEEKEKRAAELIVANVELVYQNSEKEKRAAELVIANKELLYQNDEKEKRAAELIIANNELIYQNSEKEKRAAELIIANAELKHQNEEKEKRAAELIIANNELIYQNFEKEQRAAELIIANEELVYQNKEKEKRADELVIANIELLCQNEEKEKRTIELNKINKLCDFTSRVNQNILHVKNEATLFNNACGLLTGLGQFKIGWIGLFGNVNTTITNAAHMALANAKAGQFAVPIKPGSPQAYVLNSGKHYICNDILNDPTLESWKNMARQRGICSCIILPIKKLGNVIGTFNFYAEEVDFFNVSEIELLDALAGNISFALDAFEKEKKHTATEDLVIKNEKLYRALIEKNTDMITLSSVEGKLLYGSPSTLEVLGYSLEDFKNKPIPDFIHPDDINTFKENREAVSKTPGKSFYYQLRLLHKNGSWVWCEGTDTNMLNEEGINAIVSNFRDISEKKAAGLVQEFEKSNLNALINSTNDLIWSVDKKFHLITSNQPFDEALERTFGRKINIGESTLSTAFPVEQLKLYVIYYKRAFKGESFTEVIYFDSPAESWSEISFYPIRRGDNVIGAACHSRDVTESRQSEKRLRRAKSDLMQSEARLKEAQAIARTGSFETDLINHSDIWSDEMYKISGIDKEKCNPSAELFLSLIHPDDLKRIEMVFSECARTFQNCLFEFRFVHKNGEIKYGSSEVRFEFDKNGHPTRLFGIFQDITEQKLAEVERIKIVNDLMLRNKELEQFGYIISHNLRAPIANIIGVATALSDPGINNHEKEILNIGLTVSALKLDDVVKDLNTILEIKNESDEPKEIVHFSELADDIKSDVQHSIDEANIEIKYDFSEANEIFTLKAYLQNIFYNLISNSIKYCRKQVHSIIEVKSHLKKNKLELIFKDNGLGINLKKCGDKVFGLYNRFHSHIRGKGMGLFMVKAQVEALGGKISLKSEENEGTEVKIEFEV
jgi:PAS domain S-box-containing protein